MDVLKLKSRLILHNTNARKLAEELGVTRQTVNLVILGKTKSAWIRKRIAEKLNFPMYEWQIFDQIMKDQDMSN